MVNLRINDRPVTVEDGTSILHAARQLGINRFPQLKGRRIGIQPQLIRFKLQQRFCHTRCRRI